MASASQTRTNPACILNGKSAHLQEALAHITHISSEFGVEPRVLITRRGDDVSAMAASALAEGHKPIVAGGGDGTVNAVSGNLVASGIALGVGRCLYQGAGIPWPGRLRRGMHEMPR